MKSVNIGYGSMMYTVIYQKLNGDVCYELASGSHDKKTAWRQSKKKFKRILALVPGNHKVVVGT